MAGWVAGVTKSSGASPDFNKTAVLGNHFGA
jgi:hypothetical protein